MAQRSSPRARSSAARPTEIVLPKAAPRRGRSVPNALRLRCTTRELSAAPLSPQLLSQLLWAACGINRERGPFGLCGRTAASASNSQEIDVYVALEQGAYRYDPARHALSRVASADLRPLAINRGQRALSPSAPVRLIYVADIDRLANSEGYQEPGLHDPDVQRAYYYVDTGLIAGNVYLFAACYGLGAWFHNCQREALATKLKLRSTQHALFAQTVGYPAQLEQGKRAQHGLVRRQAR
jgi:hypothetical protein